MAETFGKTNKGATEDYLVGDIIMGTKFQSGSAGTLAKISTYLKQTTSAKVKCAIYSIGKNLLPNGATEEIVLVGNEDGWVDFNFSTPPSVEASTWYWLCCWKDSGVYQDKWYCDSGLFEQTLYQTITYNGWPATLAPGGYATYAYSIYATYYEAPPAKKTLVQAALISIPPLIVLPTLGQILKLTGG